MRQSPITYHIKNMVCDRCKEAVRIKFEEFGIRAVNIELGEVQLERKLTGEEKRELDSALGSIGFSFIEDKKSRIILLVKRTIIELIQEGKIDLKTNLSEYLSKKLIHDYSYLSNLFSEVEGTTIEQFFIKHKIEKAKELIVYDELSLSEIAFELNYSSVAHLSNQFKKVTGLAPMHFKKLKESKRTPLDKI